MGKWIYDLEMYPNMFLGCFYNIETKEKKSFEVSPDKMETKELVKFVSTLPILIGYNNLAYDCQLLEFVILNNHLNGQQLCIRAKAESNRIIKRNRIAWNPVCPQIDLLKIHHFDNA